MAFKTMADNGIDISARQDGALYNVACGGADFIIKGIGDELAYTVSGLNVTVKTGEAVIHGRHVTAEANNTLRLPTNSSGYLVLRLDLSQTSGNEAYLYATPVLSKEEVNWSGNVHDVAIASFTTTTTTATLADVRRIFNSTLGGANITIENDGKPYIHYTFNGEEISKKLGSVEGTANTSDVLSGVTFMSATSEELQTGTLSLSGNATVSDVKSGKTFYNTNAKSKQTGTYTPSVSYTVLANYPYQNTSGITRTYKYTGGYNIVIADLSNSAITTFPSTTAIAYLNDNNNPRVKTTDIRVYKDLPTNSTFTCKTNDGYNHHTQMYIIGLKIS